MARAARKRAESGVYFVLLRSVNRSLFCGEKEEAAFLDALSLEKTRDFCEIYAYFLSGNKAYLVVKEGLSGISTNIPRVCSSYASYVNKARNQKGKLFYGRFLSEPLETPGEILEATRAIHRLPLKSGLSLNCNQSSYKHYFKSSDLVSSEEIIFLIGSRVDYRVYCDEEAEDDEERRMKN